MDENQTNRVNMINDFTISIKNEDHTLLNVLQHMINQNYSGEKVELCGYVIPHPSENISQLRVQFENEDKQNYLNMLYKTKEGLESIKEMTNYVEILFDREITNFRR
ncbi:DNA-directed RNA polymerases I and III subunit RPAC2 [Dictyocoela muelleri]|nr:DNA-directed RNA polymerases I and III subunit RPAC2 [Dictyocoela muelleri]